MPTTNSVDQIFQAAKDPTKSLKGHSKPSNPYLEFGDATLNALNKLANIFDRNVAESKTKTNITEDIHQPPRVKSPPKRKIIKDPSRSSPTVKMMNKQATSPVTAYKGWSREMTLTIHRYNT